MQDTGFIDTMIHALYAGSYLTLGTEGSLVEDSVLGQAFKGKPYIMGITAEWIVQMLGLTRQQVDG